MSTLHFWKWNLGADTMIGRFDKGEMSSYEKFKLFFIITVFALLISELTLWFASEFQLEYTNFDKVDSILYMAINMLGIIYLYKKHTTTTSFIEKFFVVSLATIPVIVVLGTLVGAILYTGASVFVPGVFDSVTWYDTVVMAVIVVLYYWKIGTYFN
jgi:hypothetical protein